MEEVRLSLRQTANTLNTVVSLLEKVCKIDPIEAIINLEFPNPILLQLLQKMYDKPRHDQIKLLKRVSKNLVKYSNEEYIRTDVDYQVYFALKQTFVSDWFDSVNWGIGRALVQNLPPQDILVMATMRTVSFRIGANMLTKPLHPHIDVLKITTNNERYFPYLSVFYQGAYIELAPEGDFMKFIYQYDGELSELVIKNIGDNDNTYLSHYPWELLLIEPSSAYYIAAVVVGDIFAC